jgi:hypothetical protein
MNAKHVILLKWVFVIIICIALLSSCTLPSLRPTQELVSESQTLSGNSSVPTGHGQERIEYDHHFKFDIPLSEMQVNFETKVKGFVPLNLVKIGSGPSDCDPNFPKLVYEQLYGNSIVDVTGSATFFSEDVGCSCKFSDKIDIEANGKTTYEDGQFEGRCVDQKRINIQLKEKWYNAPKWQCQCDDPDDELMADKMMASIPAISNPELENKTIKFNYLCPGTYLEEKFADPNGYGSGSYLWTWRPSFDETSDPGRAVPTQGAFSLDQDLFPEGQPSCISAAVAEWGPPLESIVQPVTAWFTE